MAGKFLKRDAIIDTVKSEHGINARRKRTGQASHPVRAASCGCPAENCGAFHWIDTSVTIPTPQECEALLAQDKQKRKSRKRPNRPASR